MIQRLRVALVTELAGEADEGMRVWVKNFRAAMATAGHEVVSLELPSDSSTAALRPSTLLQLRNVAPDVIQYVPYSGFTSAATVRMRALGFAAPRAIRSIAVLQAAAEPPRVPRALRAHVALFASKRLEARVRGAGRSHGLVYPWIDRTRFREHPVDKQGFWKEFGVPTDKPVLLHVGHLKASRNLDVLGRIAATGSTTVVMVSSTSTEADARLRAQLEADGVVVIRQFLPSIEDLYSAADLYVFPVEEALGSIEVPLSVIEARACGVPVVATPFGALPELLPPGAQGIEYAPSGELVSAALRAAAAAQPVPAGDSLAQLTPEHFVRSVEAAWAAHRRRRGPATTIVVSGVDGAGKSTQIARLTEALEQRGTSVASLWCRWDPFFARPAVRLLDLLSAQRSSSSHKDEDNPAPATEGTRREIRRSLLDKPLIDLAWKALMLGDYALRVAPKVRRARRNNEVLVLDRYWYDVLVDYSSGRELQRLPRVISWAFPKPDALILLDAPPAVAAQRGTDGHSEAYLADRRRLYSAVAQRHNAIVIDGGRDVEQVHAEMLSVAEEVISGGSRNGATR